ncbi:MAG: ABC transporter ATP-binding protein [Planctomycetia bacterium]|nr:ABC transporter ATP-binding protein [Planctomycetia bacterium]
MWTFLRRRGGAAHDNGRAAAEVYGRHGERSTSLTADAALPIRLDSVVKRYGRRTVLDQVTCDVHPGITGLVGPNGAGKSTLVRAILGLVRLAAGKVEVFGIDPAVRPRLVRQAVGVVPEDECTVPGLAAVEMVRYAARLSGLPGTEALRRAHEVLDWCDAGQERYRPVETLSVGMRQKVAFAAAIVHDPRMVILDEPTNGLDPIERRAMLGRLTTLAREHGKTILVSTHVLPDVQTICDRVIVLAAGRVRLEGSLDELTRPVVPQLRLEATGPLDACAQLLRDRGIAATRADATTLLVSAEQGRGLDEVWTAVRASGVTLRALEPARRRFEDVFLQAIARSEEGEHATS